MSHVAGHPDATMAEWGAWLAAEHGVSVCLATIWKTPDRFGLTFKKVTQGRRADRPDVAAARQTWCAAQPALDPERLIFIDETWTKTNMTRLRGRARKGERLVAGVPHGRWKTSTFLAGLRHDRLTAPAVFDGAINGELFTAYVQQVLAPTLTPGDIVVLDNLGSHKVAGVRALVEARGASLMFLPPYLPDLNPIEQVFAKLQADHPNRDPGTLCGTNSAAPSTSSRECANYLANSGYRRSG